MHYYRDRNGSWRTTTTRSRLASSACRCLLADIVGLRHGILASRYARPLAWSSPARAVFRRTCAEPILIWRVLATKSSLAGVDSTQPQQLPDGTRPSLRHRPRRPEPPTPISSTLPVRATLTGLDRAPSASPRCIPIQDRSVLTERFDIRHSDDTVVCGRAPGEAADGLPAAAGQHARVPRFRVPEEPLEFLGYRAPRPGQSGRPGDRHRCDEATVPAAVSEAQRWTPGSTCATRTGSDGTLWHSRA